MNAHTRELIGRGVAIVVGAACAAVLLAGCSTINDWRVPPVEVGAAPPVQPAAPPQPQATNGAIFQSASYRPLFEDHRARLPGDTLLVQIVEKVSATQKSTSSIGHKASADAGLSAVPFLSAKSLAKLGAKGSGANSFDGKGATESSNDFSGSITAVVTGVLPNGHLLIAGEKQIGVNANVDVLRFSGQVDPRAIQPGNTVQSVRVANVRVEQRSRGQQADAQMMGWLGRVFLNILPL